MIGYPRIAHKRSLYAVGLRQKEHDIMVAA